MLLVEPSAYATTLDRGDTAHLGVQAKKVKVKRSQAEKLRAKEWAFTHGAKRGGCDGNDAVPLGTPPVVDAEANDEGLLAFAQSVTCRRKVWAAVFGGHDTEHWGESD